MQEAKLNDPGFKAFCERAKKELGEASEEILYAWYYDTFKTKTADNGKKSATDEKK